MDRRIALERLDAVRPGSDDLALPDLHEAREALTSDPTLAIEFERRQKWDCQIAAAMQDVPIPDGLKDRLLVRLAASEQAVAAKPQRVNRRRLLTVTAGLAASLVAGGLFWIAAPAAEPIPVTAIRDAAGALLAGRLEAAPFEGTFSPQLSRDFFRQRLSVREPAVGLLDHRVAAWQFQSNGRRPLHGVLAAIPVDQVTTPPAARSLADREYVVDANSVTWREGDVVYVCYVDGGIDELLRRLGSGPIA